VIETILPNSPKQASRFFLVKLGVRPPTNMVQEFGSASLKVSLDQQTRNDIVQRNGHFLTHK
jgi:hypothetical protein